MKCETENCEERAEVGCNYCRDHQDDDDAIIFSGTQMMITGNPINLDGNPFTPF